MRVDIKFDPGELRAIRRALSSGIGRKSLRRAGSTALRDGAVESNRRIRRRKKLKVRIVRRALTLRRPGRTGPRMEWAIDVRGTPVKLQEYAPRKRMIRTGRGKRRGVSVEVNVGKRTIPKGAFTATLRSGHTGVFRRLGRSRLPIRELLGSRPADALLHHGEAEGVQARMQSSFVKTFRRNFDAELAKAGAKPSGGHRHH